MKKLVVLIFVVLGIATVLLILLLVQNSEELKTVFSVLTPAKTAVRHAKEMTVAGFHIDPNTVKAIQQVEVNDLVLVLVQYGGHRIEGEAELCEMALEVEKMFLHHWKANGGSGLCHKINDPDNTVPISIVSSFNTTTLLDRGYSTAFGYLRDEQITKVVVTWEDGLAEPASIAEDTYLIAREGVFQIGKIEAYNNSGKIYFETDFPSTEESKQ